MAGSQRADFPGQTESLVLSVAANQAVIGLQEARLLSDQKRGRAISLHQMSRTADPAFSTVQTSDLTRRRLGSTPENKGAGFQVNGNAGE